MLSNSVIIGLPVLLAGSLFLLPICSRSAPDLLPICYRSASRLRCAVAILSALLVALGKIPVINSRMVHMAHYPKHRRCY